MIAPTLRRWADESVTCRCGYEGPLVRLRVGDGSIEEDCPDCGAFEAAAPSPDQEDDEQ